MTAAAAAAALGAVLLISACAPTDPAAYLPATTTAAPTTTLSTPSMLEDSSTAPTTRPVASSPPATSTRGTTATPATTISTTTETTTTTTITTITTTISTAVATPTSTTTTTAVAAPTSTAPTSTATSTTTSPPVPVVPAPVAPPAGRPATSDLRTACRQVVHIGDSTGLAMWAAADVGGDPAATMDARYGAIGVQAVHPDNSGGRSMVERLPGQANAVEVAETVRAGGYDGCWVLMIGTNDAANVGAGGTPGLDERIARLLDVIGGQPVLWVNAVSRSADPVYGDTVMQQFDAALDRAVAAHPNLRVLDWARLAQADWFAADGLHYSTLGRAWRAAVTAQALALAFPADPSTGD